MAVVITKPVVAVSDTSNLSAYSTASFTATGNALLVLFSFSSGSTSQGAVTGAGLIWTPQSYAVASGSDSMNVFWARTPASPSASAITYNCADDAATGNMACVLEFTGVDMITKNPIRQVVVNSATSTNARVIFPLNVDTNNGYAAAWAGTLGTGSSAPPTGWTEDTDGSYGTPNRNLSVAHRATGETGTTFTFTNNSTAWIAVGVEVYASGAGPVGCRLALVGVG